MLTDDQRRGWERDGYIALRRFFTDEAMDALNAVTEELYRHPPGWLVVDNTLDGRRGRLGDFTPQEQAAGHLRFNNLFRERAEERAVALDGRVRAILRELLGEPAVLCNSLTFTKGSQQTEHIDSLYLTPPTPGKLVAAWVAREDAHRDAGQLFYYPGSHHIPLYTFADGGHRARPAEMPDWMRYIHERITAAGLTRETFPATKGDLFLWSANLVHGGSPITDPTRTRKSLVCHYLAHSDTQTLGFDCVPEGDNAYWLRR
jgi:phytanoyl-CoA hydroxylase